MLVYNFSMYENDNGYLSDKYFFLSILHKVVSALENHSLSL